MTAAPNTETIDLVADLLADGADEAGRLLQADHLLEGVDQLPDEGPEEDVSLQGDGRFLHELQRRLGIGLDRRHGDFPDGMTRRLGQDALRSLAVSGIVSSVRPL